MSSYSLNPFRMANDLAPDGLLPLLDVEIDIAIFLLLLVIRWLETESKLFFLASNF
jgi:hypothetical protein